MDEKMVQMSHSLDTEHLKRIFCTIIYIGSDSVLHFFFPFETSMPPIFTPITSCVAILTILWEWKLLPVKISMVCLHALQSKTTYVQCTKLLSFTQVSAGLIQKERFSFPYDLGC